MNTKNIKAPKLEEIYEFYYSQTCVGKLKTMLKSIMNKQKTNVIDKAISLQENYHNSMRPFVSEEFEDSDSDSDLASVQHIPPPRFCNLSSNDRLSTNLDMISRNSTNGIPDTDYENSSSDQYQTLNNCSDSSCSVSNFDFIIIVTHNL